MGGAVPRARARARSFTPRMIPQSYPYPYPPHPPHPEHQRPAQFPASESPPSHQGAAVGGHAGPLAARRLGPKRLQHLRPDPAAGPRGDCHGRSTASRGVRADVDQ